MLRRSANNKNPAKSLDHFAILAHRFNAGSYFHEKINPWSAGTVNGGLIKAGFYKAATALKAVKKLLT